MPAAPRHAKSRSRAARLRAPSLAAVTLASVTAAFVFLYGGTAAPRPSAGPVRVTSAGSGFIGYEMITAVHRDAAASASRVIRRARRAALTAARLAHRRAAQQPPPSPSSSPAPAPGGGRDAAGSPLGICIRNAEEGGSYAWGPGNGGGAYQFLLSTWERYGGAASEFGVAGPAYQDRIFDNAIAAGGASNWTDYDGC